MLEETCMHRSTYEEEKADQVRRSWKYLSERAQALGFSSQDLEDFKPSIDSLAIFGHRKLLVIDSSDLYSDRVIENRTGLRDQLLGFVAYGFKLRNPLPGLDNEYFAYLCNACNVLSVGSPEIQTISERNKLVDAVLESVMKRHPENSEQGIIYICKNCKRDMLREIVKNPITIKRDP